MNDNKAYELRARIEGLIDYASKLAERAKNLQRLLYRQKDELVEIEKLDSVGDEFLEAYLLWKSIQRANYQPEHLKLTSYNKDKLLNIIIKEVEMIEINNTAQLTNELSDENLIRQLGIRIKAGKIKKEWNQGDQKGLWYLYTLIRIMVNEDDMVTEDDKKAFLAIDLVSGEMVNETEENKK